MTNPKPRHAMDTMLVTGGAGFIGSNFIRQTLDLRPSWRLVNLDALTYAGNAANLEAPLTCPNDMALYTAISTTAP